jgi:hypothetical protein
LTLELLENSLGLNGFARVTSFVTPGQGVRGDCEYLFTRKPNIATAIFNALARGTTNTGDKKRTQIVVSPNSEIGTVREALDFTPALSSFIDEVNEKLRVLLHYLYVRQDDNEVAVLCCSPGCQQQPPHVDIQSSDWEGKWEVTDEQAIRGLYVRSPLSALVAIEDCSLLVWVGSHVRYMNAEEAADVKVPCVRVQLKRGDMVVLRGDTLHAGDGWVGNGLNKNNYRLHMHMDFPTYARGSSMTGFFSKAQLEDNNFDLGFYESYDNSKFWGEKN